MQDFYLESSISKVWYCHFYFFALNVSSTSDDFKCVFPQVWCVLVQSEPSCDQTEFLHPNGTCVTCPVCGPGEELSEVTHRAHYSTIFSPLAFFPYQCCYLAPSLYCKSFSGLWFWRWWWRCLYSVWRREVQCRYWSNSLHAMHPMQSPQPPGEDSVLTHRWCPVWSVPPRVSASLITW